MLIKPTILDTQLGVQTNFRSQLTESIGFLIKNTNYISVPEKDLIVIKSMKNFGNSHVYSLFETIIDSDKINIFKFLDFSKVSIDNIPEILTLSSLTIDNYNNGIYVPNEYKKVLCNITPHIKKRTSESDRLNIVDIDSIHSLIVRGALCKSYNDSRLWLTADLAAMIIESYALTISNILSSVYKLDFQDSNLVTLMFATYYAQLLNIDGSMEYPELLSKCKRLEKMGVDITALSFINKQRKNPKALLTLKEVCEIVAICSTIKMKSFNINTLNSLFSRGSVDIQIMLTALEYPPYFVMQLIRLADNHKNQVMLANINNKKIAPAFVELLRLCSNFIPKL